jgi:hypothetical protein
MGTEKIELINGKLLITYINNNKELETYIINGKELIDLINSIKNKK